MTNILPNPTRPVVLCILDGWGNREENDNNAIILGTTPHYDALIASSPRSLLNTSGLAVGLPEGQMGNSEVGHMNLGGGRVVLQDLPRINHSIEKGEFLSIESLNTSIQALKKSGGTCHLMGLLSPGGVHSHQNHMIALARAFDDAGVPVALHAFLDGRDVAQKSAENFIRTVEQEIAGLKNVKIATLCGRYYAMDRDQRWNRVVKAYANMVQANGLKAESALEALQSSYADEIVDEFVLPVTLGSYAGMKDGDGLVMANFRADRAREILSAFVDPDFEGFERGLPIDFACRTGMVSYSRALDRYVEVLFPKEELADTLGEIVARNGMTQLRIAETEKYAHVTFFFNGGSEDVYEGEERILVPSPDVATYDLQPEMSAPELTDKLTKAIRSEKFDLIVVNYANPDMVGHSGNLKAAIKAVEAVDHCLGRVQEALIDGGGTMLVTADHGNIELMKDPESGQPHTAHTTNLVPFILVNSSAASAKLAPDMTFKMKNGNLCDVAPTLLSLLGLEQPIAMTGSSLLEIISLEKTTRSAVAE